jgi:ATP-dependent helicase/nuclease subunit A
MAEVQWTPAQRQAMDARGGTLLVSAAAGSGKTTVLVERVLRRLCDAAQPCGVDELLIVTFTKAAAAHMRECIDQAMEKKLQEMEIKSQETPERLHLLRQKQLLPLADICTIDSFCLRLVKEHAPLLGLPPELRLLDPSERTLLQAQAAEQTLEAAYRQGDLAFQQLGLLLEAHGDDQKLVARLQKVAEMAMATPSPDGFLAGLTAEYRKNLPPQTSVWGQVILEEAQAQLQQCRALCEQSLQDLEGSPPLRAKYAKAFLADLQLIQALSAQVYAGDWDALYTGGLKCVRLENKPKNSDETLVALCQKRRKWVKTFLEKGLPALFCVSAQEHFEDNAAAAPVAERFVALVRDYLSRYAALKQQRQAAEFNDNLHWTLALLLDEQGCRTPLALRLSSKYREILVDEYQDINAAQEQLFQALTSESCPLFLVGDVKQSIYRFRQADPTLFLDKRHQFSPYNGKNFPAYLLLGSNFRSRPGVTDGVNFFLRQLMREEAFEIAYSH